MEFDHWFFAFLLRTFCFRSFFEFSIKFYILKSTFHTQPQNFIWGLEYPNCGLIKTILHIVNRRPEIDNRRLFLMYRRMGSNITKWVAHLFQMISWKTVQNEEYPIRVHVEDRFFSFSSNSISPSSIFIITTKTKT